MTVGVVTPIMGLIWKVPLHVLVLSSVFVRSAFAEVTEFPLRDVALYTMPVVVQSLDFAASLWRQELSTEWAVLLCFILSTLAM